MKRARHSSPSLQSGEEAVHRGTGLGGQTGRPPKVSRKVHACTECQNRKIKCDLRDGVLTCSRCRKKGLRCVVNKSLQALLEDEINWKSNVQNESDQLRAAVSHILHSLNLPPLDSFVLNRDNTIVNGESPLNPSIARMERRLSETRSPNDERRHSHQPRMAMTRENSQEADDIDTPVEENMVSDPMGTLYEVTKLRNIRSNPRNPVKDVPPSRVETDFIARGLIELDEAESLFATFNSSLNHYLWGGIALLHDSLDSMRRSSTLLLAALLTVTALHIPGKTDIFDVCYAEFLEIVSESMFGRYHTMDDIRGLCVGAFWLSDVSWKLSGHGVRIATELNLHRSCARAINGSTDDIEGARLWYLLYVCDHHFSIAYGRPPVIHDDASIVGHERFLRTPAVTDADMRLHSQVSLFVILTKIYQAFGPDAEQRISEHDLILLQRFNTDLDNWDSMWERQLQSNVYIASYPVKGVILHYNFGKLQLTALALRGLKELDVASISIERRNHAYTAVSCAIVILQLVMNEPDIRKAVVGVPLYLHTMITYAAVFLLKVHSKWKDLILGTSNTSVHDLVEQVVLVLKNAKASHRHLSYHIAAGLARMLQKSRLNQSQEHRDIRSGMQVHLSPDIGQDAVASPSNGHLAPFDSRYAAGGADFGSAEGNMMMDLFDHSLFPIGFLDGMNDQFTASFG